MSKKVLVISTSPRKGGNSDTLADAFVQGAREAGNTVELTCSLDIEEGEAAIFLCSGSEEPVLLLSESGDYSGTIEVGSGSVYLGVWGEGVTGSVSIQIE